MCGAWTLKWTCYRRLGSDVRCLRCREKAMTLKTCCFRRVAVVAGLVAALVSGRAVVLAVRSVAAALASSLAVVAVSVAICGVVR